MLFKALHLIFMTTWFAGLFYLPRLFVYHAMPENAHFNATFKVMERKLYYGIMTPSAVLTGVFGVWMLYDYAWQAYAGMGWLHLKLLLVVILGGYHGWCGKLLADFKHERNRHTQVWYRWFNEVPVGFLVVIILLASFKPF